MNAVAFLFVIILIPVFISIMFIPYWTRKTESFGVSIPEKIYYSNNLKMMRKQYAGITGIFSGVIIAIFIVLGSIFNNDEYMISVILSIIITVYIIGCFLIYLAFYRTMKRLKEKENWKSEKSQLIVINTRFRDQKLTFSNAWFVFSFVIAIITTLISFRLYNRIPEKIPMQYNFSGEVTNWTDKSYRSILLLPIMQVYMTLLFLFINTMIAKAKQQVSAEKPEQSMLQNVTFRRRWSLFIIITGTALVLMFSLIQLSFIYPINQQLLTIIPLVISAGVVIATIILAITTGQGGSRVKISTGENEQVINRDDDQFWKLGQFYINKNDPALFLEKRFGVGWTINFAHPIAWITLIVIILAAVGIPILLGI